MSKIDFAVKAASMLDEIGWLKTGLSDWQRDHLKQRVADLLTHCFELGQGTDSRCEAHHFEDDLSLSPTEARLLELLELRDEAVAEAERDRAGAHAKLSKQRKAWYWCHHRHYDKDPQPELPLPRLEIQLRRVGEEDWWNFEWLYGLMYEHHAHGIYFVPFGMTMSSSGRREAPEKPSGEGHYEPFRESHHVRTDMERFKLPGFYTCRELGWTVSIKPFAPREP